MTAPSSAAVEAARLLAEQTGPAGSDDAGRLVFYAAQIVAEEVLRLAGETS